MKWPARASAAVVVAILRSPVHRLLGRNLVVLSYTGKASGKRFSVPVAYARDFDDLVVFVGDHEHKRWWRNFRGGWPVRVRQRGRDFDARGLVVSGDRSARDVYVHRFPKTVDTIASEGTPLFVRITELRPAVASNERADEPGGVAA